MYVPSHFAETRPEVLEQFIRSNALATLVTAGPGGLMANHIPLFLDAGAGVLRGHMSRANPQWREIERGLDVLAIFHGPQRYISPSWYPSKAEHGRVVPTWNYAVVHVCGPAVTYDDPERILANVTELTDQQESAFRNPWKVSDAPVGYVEGIAKGIIGVQVTIHRMEGKFKLSQNRPQADRRGVVDGLADVPGAGDMIRMMRDHSDIGE
jgi:transcriptional regulator